MQNKLRKIEKFLNSQFVERAEEIHGLSLGLLSGSNVLLLGPPGVAKSLLVDSFAKVIKNANYFSWLLTSFSTPEELAGPYSLSELENDRFIRHTNEKLPEAHIAFIDETWKGNSGILNFLLTMMNERIFYNDGKAVPVPLITLIGASNELPEDGDGLEAMLDRFTLKYTVKPIQEGSNFAQMMARTDASNISTYITLQEIEQAQQGVNNVHVSSEMLELVVALRNALITDGVIVSDRTYMFAKKVLQSEAYFHGRDAVIEEDFDILQHCLWNDPDNVKTIYSHILDLTNPEKSRILELFDDAEEIFTQVMALDEKDPQRLKDGVETAVKLKDAKKKMHSFYTKLKEKGKDTTEVRQYESKLDEFLTTVYNEACGVKFE